MRDALSTAQALEALCGAGRERLGAAVGVVGGLRAGSVALGLIVGGALLAVLVGAAAAGILIPLGLKLIRQNPAAGSTVLLTTATDVIGFTLLLGIATLLIRFLV